MLAGMKTFHLSQTVHPAGEAPRLPSASLPVDMFGGRIHVEWDPQAAVTPLGQLPFFIEFLKTAELFVPWVRDCPLTYHSPNAPQNLDVLGTLFLSILSGHQGLTQLLFPLLLLKKEDKFIRVLYPADLTTLWGCPKCASLTSSDVGLVVIVQDLKKGGTLGCSGSTPPPPESKAC